MKFLTADVDNIADKVTVQVTEQVSLTFHALPITWDIDVKQLLPEPVGNDDDVGCLAAVDRHNRYTSMLMIIDSLEPGQIEFETPYLLGNTEEFIKGVAQELADAGFNARHFKIILDALTKLNGYTQEVIDEVEPDFFDMTGS